jgi:hypothetical protein
MTDLPFLKNTSGIEGVVCEMSFRGVSYTVALGKTRDDVWHVGLRQQSSGEWAQFALSDVEAEPSLYLKTDTIQAEINERDGMVWMNGVSLFTERSQSIPMTPDGQELFITNVVRFSPNINIDKDDAKDLLEGGFLVALGIGKIIWGIVQIVMDPKNVVKGILSVGDGVYKVVKGIGKLLKVIFGKKDSVMIPPECHRPNPPDDCQMWLTMGDTRFGGEAIDSAIRDPGLR